MIRRFALAIVAMAAGLLFVPGGAIAAAPSTTVIAVNYKGAASVDLVVEIPRGIDIASRNGAGWSSDATLTYVSGAGTVETLDSGQVLVNKNTSFLSALDPNTDTVTLSLLLGAALPPGANPAYSATAELFDPGGTLIGSTTSTPSF